MRKQEAEKFFKSINKNTIKHYTGYWESLTPSTDKEVLKRYMFAFMSVHTTWKGNINGYNAIKDLTWLEDKELLRTKLKDSKSGMHNVRTEYLWKFKEQFEANPKLFTHGTKKWAARRNLLANQIVGIGMAKVSFTLEMCFPTTAQITCLDTHGIQLYDLPVKGFKSKSEVETYEKVERHWVKLSREAECSPYIARCIYWDKKQGRRNTRYWSHVLEL